MFDTTMNIMLYAIAHTHTHTHTDHANYWSQTFDMHTIQRIAAAAATVGLQFSHFPMFNGRWSMIDVRAMLMIGLFIVGY